MAFQCSYVSVEKSVFALVEDTRLLRSEVRAVNEKCTNCEELFKESQSSNLKQLAGLNIQYAA